MLLKCIRCVELLFETESDSMIARWSDLKDLFKVEESKLAKMSNLTETAVYPTPIEG